MAQSPRYSVQFRRRREGKTDYKLRLGLVRSGRPRVVVRMSNTYVYLQIVESRPGGDVVRASSSSKELSGLGWKGGTANLPAAYLTGMLGGRRGLAQGIGEAVLDIGLRASTKGSRVYAALKGLVDAGMNIPHSEDVLPSEERLGGHHVAGYAKSLSSEAGDTYKKRFSGYLGRGLKPEGLAEHFEQLKRQISSVKVET